MKNDGTNGITLTCQDEQRRHAVRHRRRNGLDYLEVSDNQRSLCVYFLGPMPTNLTPANVQIVGGRRIRDIEVEELRPRPAADSTQDSCLQVRLNRWGDFSTYTLRLVALDDRGKPTGQTHPDFDPRYAQLDFSFKVGCPNELDCKTDPVCPPAAPDEPEIDYLAKDYASFRQLMLDRLALLMPGWRDRHVPDLGIAVVEVLAYVGDYLSYYQDAVATEAYLETARQRISLRRHGRLVDYDMHEGCNARVWVQLLLQGVPHQTLMPQEFYLITGLDGAPAGSAPLPQADLRTVPGGQYEVFEPIDFGGIELYQGHNLIRFYSWGDRQCCLPPGATSATLQDGWQLAPPPVVDDGDPDSPGAPDAPDAPNPDSSPSEVQASSEPERMLHLQVGDVLILEEVKGATTGNPADADPAHRHPVRLTRVEAIVDDLYDQPVLDAQGQPTNQRLPVPLVEVEWAWEDRLPFPLCISALGLAPECRLMSDISVARGNVVLADHGRTIGQEDLGTVPEAGAIATCEAEALPAEIINRPAPFRPRLAEVPLTCRQPISAAQPATQMQSQNPRLAMPQVQLSAIPAPPGEADWQAQADLLGSNRGDRHFVAEVDNEGRAHLRFGDGDLGQQPLAGTTFLVTYRVGNGSAGNVGAETLAHVVLRQSSLSGISLKPRNLLPAQGGTDPEPLAEVKLFVPHAFRQELQRAITAQDYADIVMAQFSDRVQRAAATLRWTGSWYEVLVAVDPLGSDQPDPALLADIRACLYRYRRIGHDLVVQPAVYVPLSVKLKICVHPAYLRGHVKAALLQVFSSRIRPDGQRGWLHPDNLTFGQGVYLSQIVAAAQAVDGVENVHVIKFERLFEGDSGERASSLLPLGPLEIARLDNDPSLPENGRLELEMEGGR